MIKGNIKEEIDLLTNWLVSIPSISNSKGESVIIKAIYDGLSDFSYFKRYSKDLLYIPHDDQKNNSILAFVENKKKPVNDTIILVANVDTLSAERFAQYKPYAFKADDLKERIIELSAGLKYNPHDYMFGLGVLQCKYSLATMIAMVKELSEIQDELNVNIIFLCLSNSLIDNRGIKSSLEYLDLLIKRRNLNPLLSLSTRPCDDRLEHNDRLEIYTSNSGLLTIGFYILGRGSSPNSPFSGFSSSLLTSILCKNIELNPRVLQHISSKVQLPIFNNINYRQCASLSSPDSIQISFSLPFFNLDFNDAIDEFKEICARSIEECSDLLDDRQNLLSSIEKKEFIPEVLDAEVITFEDLFKRASKVYKGDLHSAIDALSEKCRRDGLGSEQINHAIIDRLNDLARLPQPSIIIYVHNDFIPQQNIQNYSQKDRDTMLILDKVVNSLKDRYPGICLSESTFTHTDANFLHPIALDRSLQQIKPISPLSIENYYFFNIPSITLALKGNDCSYPTERVHSSMGMYIVDFISSIVFDSKISSETVASKKSSISGISALTESLLSPVKKLFRKKAAVEDTAVTTKDTVVSDQNSKSMPSAAAKDVTADAAHQKDETNTDSLDKTDNRQPEDSQTSDLKSDTKDKSTDGSQETDNEPASLHGSGSTDSKDCDNSGFDNKTNADENDTSLKAVQITDNIHDAKSHDLSITDSVADSKDLDQSNDSTSHDETADTKDAVKDTAKSTDLSDSDTLSPDKDGTDSVKKDEIASESKNSSAAVGNLYDMANKE
ncbi:Uncharacterised protein [Anaerobiospirillum thomasii]|uniref:hypothetical protein n=1 Tax=Anaerobiospirillum thomasii TaxID=179995 RepID=UPI000D909AE9|nr:hypothetical protein [Anaerobiospirillum thomasii]SPT67783.1 Uncharacterised protein [Anaerobiospirillum thomasii]